MESINIQQQGFNFRNYLKVLLRRKWMIIAILVVIVTFTAIKASKEIPVYQAHAQVIVNQETPNLISVNQMFSTSEDTTFYITQKKILKNRPIALKVINTLDLGNSPEFNFDSKANSFSIKGLFRRASSSTAEELKPEKKSQKSESPKVKDDNLGLINHYLSKITVAQVGNSRILSISARGYYPDILATICNTHAQKYIEYQLEARFASTQNAAEWLQNQLLEKKNKVEEAEETLQLYQEKHNIVDLGKRETMIEQKFNNLSETLTQTRAKRLELETLYKQIRKYSEDPSLINRIPEILGDSLVNTLRSQHLELKAEIRMLSEKYGRKHPNIIRANLEEEELKKRIMAETNNLKTKLETECKILREKEKSYKQAYEEQSQIMQNLIRTKLVYGRIERETKSERVLYDMLLNRMKETGLTAEIKTSRISIIEPAIAPSLPINPSNFSKISKSVILGLAIGIGLAFFLEYIDNTVKSTEDVENYLGTTLLGLIEKAKIPKTNEECPVELISNEMPKSILSEAIRNIRTGIMLYATDKPNKLLLVTSTRQSEGKTFIATNLAITIAQTGKNTLIVDADFRKPRIHKVFGIDLKPGLSNHFLGEVDLESIIRPTGIPNLSTITCGIIPPNPSELLGSHSMQTFCNTVRERFDTVIFDTPPSMVVTDALVLSKIVDGVVFVIKAGKTPKEISRRAITQYMSHKREFLGVVLNMVDISRSGYYSYYYQYGYGYGYGISSREKKKGKRKEKDTAV